MTVLSLIKEIDMKDIIVCDLDGTLANCEHRVHHVQKTDGAGLRRKPNWDAFYAGVREDTVNVPVLHVLDKFMFYEGAIYNLIFCTGRPERCRADTEAWIVDMCHIYEFTLLMRKDGDFRADNVVKQEILDAHIDKDRVLFVLDDRQQVVDMWRRNGLTCFQVAEGNF
jgi:hypothetical protein